MIQPTNQRPKCLMRGLSPWLSPWRSSVLGPAGPLLRCIRCSRYPAVSMQVWWLVCTTAAQSVVFAQHRRFVAPPSIESIWGPLTITGKKHVVVGDSWSVSTYSLGRPLFSSLLFPAPSIASIHPTYPIYLDTRARRPDSGKRQPLTLSWSRYAWMISLICSCPRLRRLPFLLYQDLRCPFDPRKVPLEWVFLILTWYLVLSAFPGFLFLLCFLLV
ncbi:hypothetical protein QBC41DRAFT_144636 [Cercophora samala]|uniref:Uncharacterized protein n=1 Tax=Cercophora samala TaxID=330535 RepID=A0AA39ZAW8_9PEZI|nr:hypothetical protein QBC41DRAFT_144636 [Cercophora samala]